MKEMVKPNENDSTGMVFSSLERDNEELEVWGQTKIIQTAALFK